MDGYFFSTQLDEDRTLCLAPLSDRNIELSGEDVPDPSGYFLYERSGSLEDGRVEIIAQVATPEAAWRLRGLLGMK